MQFDDYQSFGLQRITKTPNPYRTLYEFILKSGADRHTDVNEEKLNEEDFCTHSKNLYDWTVYNGMSHLQQRQNRIPHSGLGQRITGSSNDLRSMLNIC